MLKNLAFMIVGGVTALVLVLSCGDDVADVDAQAACDCPEAEPPLADRLHMVDDTASIAAGTTGGQGVGCPSGEILITGDCTGDGVALTAGVELIRSGADDGGSGNGKPINWSCVWNNTTASPVGVKAVAFCLTPPPASN